MRTYQIMTHDELVCETITGYNLTDALNNALESSMELVYIFDEYGRPDLKPNNWTVEQIDSSNDEE